MGTVRGCHSWLFIPPSRFSSVSPSRQTRWLLASCACFNRDYADRRRLLSLVLPPPQTLRTTPLQTVLMAADERRRRRLWRRNGDMATSMAAVTVTSSTTMLFVFCSREKENYVHRIGRTGRAGRKARAHTSLADVDDDASHAQSFVSQP
jgi:hypothetical protein